MELTENQKMIAETIRSQSSGTEPFTTIGDIADSLPISKQTVLNNINEVIENCGDIDYRKVGQANVYYLKTDRLGDIQTEDSEVVGRLESGGKASYYELRNASEESPFDYVAHWYDFEANEIEGYFPNNREIGEVTGAYATDPVAIEFYDEKDLGGWEKVGETPIYEKFVLEDEENEIVREESEDEG